MYGPASLQDVRPLLRFSISMPALTAALCLIWGSVLDDPTPVIVLSMAFAVLVGAFLPMGAIASEEICGWRTFLVSSGVSRRRVVAMRFATTSVLPSVLLGVLCGLALAAAHPGFAIPASVCSASCCLMMSSSSVTSKFDGENGLSTQTIIVGSASTIVALIMMMAATGSGLGSAAVLGTAVGVLALIAGLAISIRSFSRTDL